MQETGHLACGGRPDLPGCPVTAQAL